MTSWIDRNALVRLVDGNYARATYVGVSSVHTIRAGDFTTELTLHAWRLEDGRIAVCTHPIGDGITRPMEIKKEMM